MKLKCKKIIVLILVLALTLSLLTVPSYALGTELALPLVGALGSSTAAAAATAVLPYVLVGLGVAAVGVGVAVLVNKIVESLGTEVATEIAADPTQAYYYQDTYESISNQYVNEIDNELVIDIPAVQGGTATLPSELSTLSILDASDYEYAYNQGSQIGYIPSGYSIANTMAYFLPYDPVQEDFLWDYAQGGLSFTDLRDFASDGLQIYLCHQLWLNSPFGMTGGLMPILVINDYLNDLTNEDLVSLQQFEWSYNTIGVLDNAYGDYVALNTRYNLGQDYYGQFNFAPVGTITGNPAAQFPIDTPYSYQDGVPLYTGQDLYTGDTWNEQALNNVDVLNDINIANPPTTGDDVIGAIGNVIGGIEQGVRDITGSIATGIEGAISGIGEFITDGVSTITGAITGAIDTVIDFFTPTDTTPFIDGFSDFFDSSDGIQGLFNHYLPSCVAQYAWVGFLILIAFWILRMILNR